VQKTKFYKQLRLFSINRLNKLKKVIWMAIKEPSSMDECVYFTRRTIPTAKIMVWVSKEECPKCHKSLMGKPKDKKGKVMIRAKEYTCYDCGHTESKEEYESRLTASAKFTCLKCNSDGEQQISFKRKNIDGIKTLRFTCDKCENNIDVTKKMKEKGKKAADKDDEDDF